MSSNNRIFYACQGVAISNMGVVSGVGSDPALHPRTFLMPDNMVHGVQSVSMTTTFNPEQAFELGQIEIYENIEGTPDVEVSIEKAIDGYPLVYHMATTGVKGSSFANSGLTNRSKQRCDLRLGIYDEGANNIGSATAAGGSGIPEVEIYCSGMYVSSVGYTIPVEGFATESVSLIGNNKQWLTGANVHIGPSASDEFDGNDSPLGLGVDGAPSGGIQRREDVMTTKCIFPASVRGTTGTAAGNAHLADDTGAFGSGLGIHVQNISINTDFSREDVFELGRKTPYYRPAGFPIEVTCEIEAITTSGDFVFAYEDGDPALHSTASSGNNTQEESIFIQLRGGHAWDLGSKNRLTSVTYGGGDATGGNVSTTYSYTNFNDLDVQWSGDYIGFNFTP
tara:strand:+ start:381 stop:1562 length:1182 start_codon:yes stop_codon:yes gene_type:complete